MVVFNRELADTQFIRRWGIVRTLRTQTVAEHSFLVAHYANDICVFFDIDPDIHLSVLQYALWHDVDEILTTDIPGPNKRALLGDYATLMRWKQKLAHWMSIIFPLYKLRSGEKMKRYGIIEPLILSIVKVADWLEATLFLASEAQMGNRNAESIIVVPNFEGAMREAKNLLSILQVPDREKEFLDHLHRALHEARTGNSKGLSIAL